MNRIQLIQTARRKAFDLDSQAPLWSDEEWLEYANDSENEACRRARLLVDSETAAICTISIVAGTASYPLDPRIIQIRRVKLASRTRPLDKMMTKDLDAQMPGWESATGAIEVYNLDYTKGKIRFVRSPTTNDTATITVVRTPLLTMGTSTTTSTATDTSTAPEILPRYHMGIVNGMLERAFQKEDTETLNLKKAERYGALFAQEFGPKSSAIDEQWINEHHGYDQDEGLF